MSNDQRRQPTGTPTGGQFAGTARAEITPTLTPTLRSLDVDAQHSRGVEATILVELAVAENAHLEASLNLLGSTRAMDAGPDPDTAVDTAVRNKHWDRVAAEFACSGRVERAQGRLKQARAQLDADRARYPWAGSDTPVIDLHGAERPVTVAPSGRYGFYEPPETTRTSGRRRVAIAQNIDGTWHPTGASYFEDTIQEHDPGCGLAIDAGQGWGIDPADAAEFVQFANQGGLQ